jgi:hypothetical protein
MLNLFDKDKFSMDNPTMMFLVAIIIFLFAGTTIYIMSNDLSSIVFALTDINNNNNSSDFQNGNLNDGKIWSGTVTFTASKPIEIEILHTYSPEPKPDKLHGEPYHAILPGNKSIAITHMRDIIDVPIEINGTGMSSGSLNFVGNALVFHKTTGEPFTVTYTIDAQIKDISK